MVSSKRYRLAATLFLLTGARLILAAEPVRLTTDGRPKRDPLFWPGKNELVYAVESKTTGAMHLVRRSLDDGENGGKVVSFSDDEQRSDREPTVSSDGSVYAYNVVRGLSSKVTVVDTKRGTKTHLPHMGRANWTNWPSLSPDGKTVLFTEAAAVIYSYDLVANKGKESVRRLSPDGPDSVSDYWPRFSPDGKSIVFASNRDEDFEIYRMNPDGSGQRRLTRSRGIDMHPVYSPDGSRIAFTSNRDGNHEVYVMNADGGDARRLTKNPERDDHPSWHPDGRRLVIVSERDGDFDLYWIDAGEKPNASP